MYTCLNYLYITDEQLLRERERFLRGDSRNRKLFFRSTRSTSGRAAYRQRWTVQNFSIFRSCVFTRNRETKKHVEAKKKKRNSYLKENWIERMQSAKPIFFYLLFFFFFFFFFFFLLIILLPLLVVSYLFYAIRANVSSGGDRYAFFSRKRFRRVSRMCNRCTHAWKRNWYVFSLSTSTK